MEDALGDMDFKVAGDADGLTAFQMDIKVRVDLSAFGIYFSRSLCLWHLLQSISLPSAPASVDISAFGTCFSRSLCIWHLLQAISLPLAPASGVQYAVSSGGSVGASLVGADP